MVKGTRRRETEKKINYKWRFLLPFFLLLYGQQNQINHKIKRGTKQVKEEWKKFYMGW